MAERRVAFTRSLPARQFFTMPRVVCYSTAASPVRAVMLVIMRAKARLFHSLMQESPSARKLLSLVVLCSTQILSVAYQKMRNTNLKRNNADPTERRIAEIFNEH